MYFPNGNHDDPTSDYAHKAPQHVAGYTGGLHPSYLPFPAVPSGHEEQTHAKEGRADVQSPDNQPLP